MVTTDKGFLDKRSAGHAGLLVVRLKQPNLQKIHLRVMYAISDVESSEWTDLTYVMRDRVRSKSRS